MPRQTKAQLVWKNPSGNVGRENKYVDIEIARSWLEDMHDPDNVYVRNKEYQGWSFWLEYEELTNAPHN